MRVEVSCPLVPHPLLPIRSFPSARSQSAHRSFLIPHPLIPHPLIPHPLIPVRSPVRRCSDGLSASAGRGRCSNRYLVGKHGTHDVVRMACVIKANAQRGRDTAPPLLLRAGYAWVVSPLLCLLQSTFSYLPEHGMSFPRRGSTRVSACALWMGANTVCKHVERLWNTHVSGPKVESHCIAHQRSNAFGEHIQHQRLQQLAMPLACADTFNFGYIPTNMTMFCQCCCW